MNKSKKITLFGILSLFSLILLSSTDFYGTVTGSAPLNRILQFAGPLTLCSFIMPALLPGNKYFKNLNSQKTNLVNSSIYQKLIKECENSDRCTV